MAEENSEDAESKTEEPTQRRLEQALERGQVINSREVTSALMLLVLAILLCFIFPFTYNGAGMLLKVIFEHAYDIDITEKGLNNMLIALSVQFFPYLFLPLFSLIITAVFSSFIQQGQINFSAEPLMPNISKISVIAGFKRIFSLKSFMEFIKGLIKISVVFICLYLYIISNIDYFEHYQELEISALLEKTQELINHILLIVCIITSIIAGADYFYQRYEYYKSLRMTKEEVKEEHKEIEGHPEIKRKMRSIRLERIKSNLAASVPKADVVITNPTHFSVALKYDADTMHAPKIVAKGRDQIALKIREIANDNNIPLVENPELARALYNNVEIDEEIPIEYYEAVAQVISYIYKLKGKK